MKVKTEDLKIGDVIFPLKMRDNNNYCAVVSKRVGPMYRYESNTPDYVVLVRIFAEDENGGRLLEERKLVDEIEYDVIWRDVDSENNIITPPQCQTI